MTNAELIAKLQKLPKDKEVVTVRSTKHGSYYDTPYAATYDNEENIIIIEID